MKRIEVIITVKKDKGLLVFLLLIFATTAGLFFADQVRAALTCSVASSCVDVTLLKMYATGNSHAGLPASSAYTNLVCCSDAVAGLSNNCSGTFAPVGTLSGANNAHYEDWLKTNYSSANDFCLSVTSGTITVSTSTDCGTNATLFSMSGTSGTNAHVGTSTAYSTKVCASTTAPAVVSVTLDQETFSYGAMNNNTASSTLTLWGGAGITATNGDAIADFYVYGANSTGSGGGWTLADNTIGNNYIHKFCNDTDYDCTTPPANYTALTTSPALVKSTVTPSGTMVFQLQITTPTTPTDVSAQNAVVTIQASAP